MSSSRHWNVRRHVERSHNRIGQPVSDQHMTQYLTKMNPQIPHFPLSYYLLPPSPSSMFFPGHKQKNSPDKPYDFVDRILEPLRKAVEFKNLLRQVTLPVSYEQYHNIAGSSTYYSTPSATTFNSGNSKDVISHQTPNWLIGQDFGSIQIQLPPTPVDPNNILGYMGNFCSNCLVIEIKEILFSKYVGKGGIGKINHVCDPKKMTKNHQYNNNNNPPYNALQLKEMENKLLLLIALVVNYWTKNQNYLFAIEVPNPPKDCIDLTIHADDYNNWAARAIKNIHISLSDYEFIDFLQKVKNSTFAVFRIKWQGSVIYYWMGITNTPLSRLPDSSFDSSNQQEYNVDNDS